MARVKGVLTDLDGTLYRCPRYEAEIRRLTLEIASERLGVSPSEAERLIAEARRTYVTLTRSLEGLGIPRDYFYSELSRRLDYSILKPDPRIAQLLRELRRRGYRVAIITNSGRPHALNTLKALGVPLDAFDALITSSDVGEPKVSPEPYLKGLELIGARPSEAVYMGDRVEDEVKPAKQLGMITILVSERPMESPWVDYVIDTPFKVVEVLEAIERAQA